MNENTKTLFEAKWTTPFSLKIHMRQR